MSDPATDKHQDKRISKLEQLMESALARIEYLEQITSPDGVVDASTDDRQQHVAQFCQMMRKTHGETNTDLIGGA